MNLFFRKSVASPSENERAYERIGMVLGMSCRARGEGFNIFTDDVSLGGIRFVSQHALSKDDSVTLQVSLHGGQLALRGKVAWLRQENERSYRGGIAFDPLDATTRSAWHEFIERNRDNVAS